MPFTTSLITSVFYAGNALTGNANKTTAAGCDVDEIYQSTSFTSLLPPEFSIRKSQPATLSQESTSSPAGTSQPEVRKCESKTEQSSTTLYIRQVTASAWLKERLTAS